MMKSIDVNTLAETLNEYTLIDVRELHEFVEGAIEGATHLALSAIENTSLPASDKPYVIYCLRGGRSSRAIDYWQASSDSEMINLEGGVTKWLENGHELV